MSCNSYSNNSPYSQNLVDVSSQLYKEAYESKPNPASIGVVNTDAVFRTDFDLQMIQRYGCMDSLPANRDQIERVFNPSIKKAFPYVYTAPK